MIHDARHIADGAVQQADICIVGGGPAGITAALELAKSSGLKILLLESGGTYLEDETQALYAGPNLGRDYEPLDMARLRFLGGTSNHWSGYCMRLRPVDFEGRDWVPGSKWPISYDDIAPYYERAAPYVQIQQDRSFDFDYWVDKLGGAPIQWNGDLFENVVSCTSPPTLFGQTYEEQLEQAGNLTVLLHANVLEVETNDTAQVVTGLRVACIDGPQFRVQAKSYVLAQGGIETARLLLLSNRVIPAGLGNQQDQVGRYFADHIAIRPALWVWPRIPDRQLKLYNRPTSLDDGEFWATVASSDTLLRTERIGGFRFHFLDAPAPPGVRSTRMILRAARKGYLPPYLSSHIANIFTDLDDVAGAAAGKLTGTDPLDRQWLGPWLSIECIPNPDSRVLLVDETDRFGQRRIGLDWRLTEHERHTFQRATELMVQELGRLGFGRVWTELLRGDFEPPRRISKGKHAIGTARMSETPRTGVVDGNCRVHGMSNLFIAGSAVFTTGSYAQPTFSIVAFSIRLADHLKQQHRTGQL